MKMRKDKFVIFYLIFAVFVFWLGKQTNQTFEYVLLKNRELLQEL